MQSSDPLIDNLDTLNRIALTLNQEADIHKALNASLANLVDLLGLESGWIFLADPVAQATRWGKGFFLAAEYNLPPALDLSISEIWEGGCDCQDLCMQGMLKQAYNEIRCSRLANAKGDRRGLAVHASSPLRSGERTYGILNVAATDWNAFDSRALALLSNVGTQMGIALERAQLYDLLQEKRLDEQAALLELSRQLLSRIDLHDLMNYIAEELKRLLSADACAILLPGEEKNELEFQAADGWNVDPVLARRRVPTDKSSASGWVMIHQEPLLLENIQEHDPTPWTPQWLREEDFQGHAVVPLVVEGESIGALILDNRRPRQLDENEVRFLQLMANQAALAINQARLREKEMERQRLEDELNIARQIQISLFPEVFPKLQGWEFEAYYQPSRQVGGDFYDFFHLPAGEDHVGLVVADVSDKGVPAALYMAMCRTMIRSTALSGRSPAQALERANELIHKDSRADLFVSVFYAALQGKGGKLLYANAGHHPPLCIRHESGEHETLSTGGIILGSFKDVTLEEHTLELHPGDVLVLYTDGVTEAMDAQHRLYGLERLIQVVRDHKEASAAEIRHRILSSIDAFTGSSPQSDDLTLVIIKRLSK